MEVVAECRYQPAPESPYFLSAVCFASPPPKRVREVLAKYAEKVATDTAGYSEIWRQEINSHTDKIVEEFIAAASHGSWERFHDAADTGDVSDFNVVEQAVIGRYNARIVGCAFERRKNKDNTLSIVFTNPCDRHVVRMLGDCGFHRSVVAKQLEWSEEWTIPDTYVNRILSEGLEHNLRHSRSFPHALPEVTPTAKKR
jgi:hypothetical protein